MSVENNHGRVAAIYIADDKGAEMRPISQVTAVEGKGLDGDRYAEGRGAYSHSKKVVPRHITLIAREAITETDFTETETRRNIITEGVELNVLVTRNIKIGADVVARGVELCDPCVRPSVLSGKPGFKEAFENRGGLRAEILTGGEIEVGDEIIILDNDE